MKAEERQPKEWISIPEAARLIGVHTVTVQKLIGTGAFTIRQLPMCQARVKREDVLRLLEASTTPAKANP